MSQTPIFIYKEKEQRSWGWKFSFGISWKPNFPPLLNCFQTTTCHCLAANISLESLRHGEMEGQMVLEKKVEEKWQVLLSKDGRGWQRPVHSTPLFLSSCPHISSVTVNLETWIWWWYLVTTAMLNSPLWYGLPRWYAKINAGMAGLYFTQFSAEIFSIHWSDSIVTLKEFGDNIMLLFLSSLVFSFILFSWGISRHLNFLLYSASFCEILCRFGNILLHSSHGKMLCG